MSRIRVSRGSPEREAWVIAYTAYGRRGPLVSLATTTDFVDYTRLGPVMPPEDKDAALFPRRFDGRWALIHRPSPQKGPHHIWISYSPDLRHWGDHTLLLAARDGAWWDAGKIGLGPPPLETADGWLILYHGVHQTASGSLYRAGLALLDLDDPRIVLHRSDEWVFGPTEAYERVGDVVGVVFPCGWIADEAEDRLRLVLRGGRLDRRARHGATLRRPRLHQGLPARRAPGSVASRSDPRSSRRARRMCSRAMSQERVDSAP